jgi:hypothetical protein
MPRYRTTASVFLPAPYAAGAEVSYRGWPLDHLALEPIDDEAKSIAEFYKAHKNGGELPASPFVDGKLHLPLLGLPRWRLGQSFRDKEAAAAADDRPLMKAVGHSALGASRNTHAAFTSDRWPDADVEPLNEQARQVAEFAASWDGPPLTGKAWDNERHCLIVPSKKAA